MTATTMKIRAMTPRITARIVLPDDLELDPLTELTIPPWCGQCGKAVLAPPVAAAIVRADCDGSVPQPTRRIYRPLAPRVRRKSRMTYSPRRSGAACRTRPPFLLATLSTNALSRARRAEYIHACGRCTAQRGVPPGHLIHLRQGELERLRRGQPVEP